LPIGGFATLVARYQGAPNSGDKNLYLAGVVRSTTGYRAYIWRNVNGVYTVLTSAAVSLTGSFNLRFDAVGSSLRLYVGAGSSQPRLVAAAVDTKWATGTVGIRSNKGVQFTGFSASIPTVQNASLGFSDTFAATPNGQLNSTWTAQQGDFTTLSGRAVGLNPGINLATLTGLSAGDSDQKVTVKSLASGQIAGLVSHFQSTKTFYYGYIVNLNGVFSVNILKFSNGVVTRLASKPIANPGSSFTFEFKINGSSLAAFVVGSTVQATATDSSTLPNGTVGVRVSQGVALSNYQVS
jgi:hypothetical protein